MKLKEEAPQLILGLDVGANSIGWVLLEVGNEPQGCIVRSGVRVFEAGVEGQVEQGKEESRNKQRREARGRRRLLERHARRMKHLWSLLQSSGLLPEGDPKDALPALDKEISQTWVNKLGLDTKERVQEKIQFLHVFPYFLRARALDEKLSCHEIGRALYHLAQRRGFKSNRKAAPKNEKAKEEEGKVKAGISELQGEINASGARTLGEYFFRLNPEEGRIRQRYTSRSMYEEEFKAIWNAQASYYPDILTEEFRKEGSHAIFYQRPLKIRKEFIGDCELEQGRKRAPWVLLNAQRFRLLQKVNDLEFIDTSTGEKRELQPEERTTLIKALETEGDLTFSKIRKLLNLPRGRFNFEAGGNDKLPGNRTAAKLVKIFREERWNGFSQAQREQIVEDVRSIQDDEALARRGMKAWGLNEEKANDFGRLELQDGYCNLSRQALAKLLPEMETGTPYMTAVQKVYGKPTANEPADSLPPVLKHFRTLRNPAVTRTLTELRKVVNAIVHQYGKPHAIRIELARDLRKNKKDRENIWKKQRENEKARNEAKEKILKEKPGFEPKQRDIEKVLLAEECGWTCPYTGRQISMAFMLGDNPQFDVEHIIPLDRSLDDSFLNKTICYAEENRNVKRGNTPYEAYSSNPKKWEEILQRVGSFDKKTRDIKLERFKMHGKELEELLDNFVSRQLVDTAYASRLAMQYLGTLYGGHDGIDEGGRRRVQAGRGQITQYFRNVWGLNQILKDGGQKSRDDHRHHAVDAICIALTDSRTVKRLSDAARRAPSERRRRFGEVSPPWPSFLDEARRSISEIIVSHRVCRKVSGPLHEETNYSKPILGKDERGNPCEFHRVRKPLEKLSINDVKNIADPAIKKLVLEKLGDQEPKKVFTNPANLPFLPARDGRKIPIRKVRINAKVTPFTIGKEPHQRYVTTESNHHIEVVEVLKKSKPGWDGYLVSLKEAVDRLKKGEPVVKRDHGEGKRFLFSLAGGETIEIDEENGGRGLYAIKSIWEEGGNARVAFVRVEDARKTTDIKKKDKEAKTRGDDKGWRTSYIEPLRKLNCQKVVITPLGEVRRAND